MHDVLDGRMLACVRLRCDVHLGTGHVVVCPRTMCKQCFPESKRVVQLDNERSVMLCPPCFDWRRERKKWSGLCPQKIGSTTRMPSLGISYFPVGNGLGLRLRLRDGCLVRGKRVEFSGSVLLLQISGTSPLSSCFQVLLGPPRLGTWDYLYIEYSNTEVKLRLAWF